MQLLAPFQENDCVPADLESWFKFLLFVCLESESTPTHRPTPLPGAAGPPLVSQEESEVIEALKVSTGYVVSCITHNYFLF
jgi:hypothetical protein